MPILTHYELYKRLLGDVATLRDDLRSMQLQASSREAPAYEDAHDMTQELIDNAREREIGNG